MIRLEISFKVWEYPLFNIPQVVERIPVHVSKWSGVPIFSLTAIWYPLLVLEHTFSSLPNAIFRFYTVSRWVILLKENLIFLLKASLWLSPIQLKEVFYLSHFPFIYNSGTPTGSFSKLGIHSMIELHSQAWANSILLANNIWLGTFITSANL